jgi:hypothetical protein
MLSRRPQDPGRCRTLVVFALLAATVAIAATACSKQDEAGKPAAVPPLDPSAAAPPPNYAAAPPNAAAPVPAPSTAPPAAAAPTAAAPPTADPGATITGEITLPAAIAKSKPKGTLYLVARRLSDNPTARGTLIAVKKMQVTSFPLPFSLSAADMPFQNGPFDGDLALTARIDQDGDPMTHQKGDVFGTLPKVPVGSQDVKLALDQVQQRAESLAGPGAGGPMMGGASGPITGGSARLPPGHP